MCCRLVLLDVNAPKEEIERSEQEEDMDETMFELEDCEKTVKFADQSPNENKHPIAHTLDVCMDKLLNHFITECHDVSTGQLLWEKTRDLYHHMITIFDKVILPTYNTHHVQFVMFNLCCFKTAVAEAFLNYLWKKVCTPTVASVLRQTAVAYIASLIARGAFIPLT